MRAALSLCVLLCACLEIPPAIDESSVVPGATTPVADATATPETPPKATPPPPPRTTAPREVKACPIGTGRHQFCEGRKLCSRDADGCEKCVCNTEDDRSRAEFEQTNPWDMRQR